eukprot:TRINITY_DN2733_c0_g1_i1.p1 TRINITY_DN2733_c0_g1~~TRINITY_DN2733_c0_g1_i1.p1  ORF type:complete len:1398 (-),score=627.33 TRINITY_DN2733_c0_g1_i1:357-4478(-)
MDTTGLESLAESLREIEKSTFDISPDVLREDLQCADSGMSGVFRRLSGNSKGVRRKMFALLLAVHDVVSETYKHGKHAYTSSEVLAAASAGPMEEMEMGDGTGGGGMEMDTAGGATSSSPMSSSNAGASASVDWTNLSLAPATAYFSVLLSLMVSSVRSMDEEDVAGAVSLLRELIPIVPQKVLQKRFSAAATCLLLVANRNIAPEHVPCAVVRASALLFKAQGPSLGMVDWMTVPQLVPLFQMLFSLSIDSRSEVRKHTHAAIGDVLAISAAGAKHAAKTVEVFCSEVFATHAQNRPRTLHMLELLQSDILSYLPAKVTLALVPRFIELFDARDRECSTAVFVCLRLLFLNDRSRVNEALAERMLNVMSEVDVQAMDVAMVTSFCLLCSAIVVRMRRMFADSYVVWLPRIAARTVGMFAVATPESFPHVAAGLRALLHGCMHKQLLQLHPACVSAVVKSITEGLGYQYQSAWTFVLEVMETLFQVAHVRGLPVVDGMAEAVEAVSWVLLLVRTDEKWTRDLYTHAEKALGAAIRSLGGEALLAMMPLNLHLEAESDERREWLLPLLAAHLYRPKLHTFCEHFLPLIDETTAALQQSMGRDPRHRPLLRKLWSLLPAFCRAPTDAATAFSHLARRLGEALEKDVPHRPLVAEALTLLVRSFKPAPGEARELFITPRIAKASIAELRRYAGNFLPLLFNIYLASVRGAGETATSGDVRAHSGPLLECVRAFLDVSTAKEVHTHYTALMKKLLGAQQGDDHDALVALTGLTQAFMGAISAEQAAFLFEAVRPQLTHSDARLQKKTYAVLAAYLERLPGATIREQLAAWTELFSDARDHCKSQARRFRFRCLALVVEALKGAQLETFVRATVPELIAGCKEHNAKARMEAIDVLKCMARRLAVDAYISVHGPMREDSDDEGAGGRRQRRRPKSSTGEEEEKEDEDEDDEDEDDDDDGESLIEDNELDISPFINIVAAALAGKAHKMLSGTVIALTALLHHFHSSVDRGTQGALLDTVLVMMSSSVPEILRACMGFLRVAAGVCHRDVLAGRLQRMVESAVGLAASSRSSYSFDAKVILERLYRKFSFEQLEPFVSGAHSKVLSNIRKRTRRRERKVARGEETRRAPRDADEFSDDDEAEALQSEDALYGRVDRSIARKERTKGKKTKKAHATVVEAGGVLDMMDVRAVKQLLSLDRPGKGMHDDDKMFQQDVRGRFIIEDEAAIAEKARKKAAAAEEPLFTYDELMETKSLVKGKRAHSARMRAAAAMPDDYDEYLSGEEAEAAKKMFQEDNEEADEGVGHHSKRKRVSTKGGLGVHTGVEYKAKKGKGDVKKKGKVDPYAYIPLNPKQLNKRHRNTSKKQFSNIVKSKSKRNKRS